MMPALTFERVVMEEGGKIKGGKLEIRNQKFKILGFAKSSENGVAQYQSFPAVGRYWSGNARCAEILLPRSHMVIRLGVDRSLL